MNGPNSQLSLDGRNERWPLEQSTSKSLKSTRELSLTTGQFIMQANNTYVLFSGSLLRLDEAGGTIDADNKTAGNFGILSTTVASLFDSKYMLVDKC